MAPEVITGAGHGRAADVWSLGATVLEMATGRPPWAGAGPGGFGSPVAAMFRIASSRGPPPLPPDLNLSPDARDFLSLCFRR